MVASWLPLSSSFHGTLVLDSNRYGVNLLPEGSFMCIGSRGLSRHASAFRSFRRKKAMEERWLSGEGAETLPRMSGAEDNKTEVPFPWEFPARVNLKKSLKGRVIPDSRPPFCNPSSSKSSHPPRPIPWLREKEEADCGAGREERYLRISNAKTGKGAPSDRGGSDEQDSTAGNMRSRGLPSDARQRNTFRDGNTVDEQRRQERRESFGQVRGQSHQWGSTSAAPTFLDREEASEAGSERDFGRERGRGTEVEGMVWVANDSEVAGEGRQVGHGRALMAPWERQSPNDYTEMHGRIQSQGFYELAASDDPASRDDGGLHLQDKNEHLSASLDTASIDENLREVGIYRSSQEAAFEASPWEVSPWGSQAGGNRQSSGVSSAESRKKKVGFNGEPKQGLGLDGILEGFQRRNAPTSSKGQNVRFDSESSKTLFPWEMEEAGREEVKEPKPPTLAELTLLPDELKKLRTLALAVKSRVKIGKAGVSDGIVEYCHNAWRTSEVVRVKCEGAPAHNMKQTAEELERLTGGLIIWRSGGAAAIYRGVDYIPRPAGTFLSKESEREALEDCSVEQIVSDEGAPSSGYSRELADLGAGQSAAQAVEYAVEQAESGVEEEEDDVTEGLGPKMESWPLPGPIPVDADQLLAPDVRYFKPYRLLPYGVQPNLSNMEMTTLRRYAKKLPSHFMLGTNKGLEGLAMAILKMWDRIELAKVKLKRGVPNSSSERIAEELKRLTGGVLLSRDKEYIVLHRGKDFLPTPIANTLRERHQQAQMNADEEERMRLLNMHTPHNNPNPLSSEDIEPPCGSSPDAAGQQVSMVGTVAESLELQRRWQEFQQTDDWKLRKKQAAQAKRLEGVRMIERKLKQVLERKTRAAREVSKLNELLQPALPPVDQESITEEERYMFKKLGLRMKAYLELGKRGVFDGVVENMHLHWKHRELVKVICKEKHPETVKSTAQMLEYESGGILVCVETIKKDFSAIVVYRGKNYSRPQHIRPKTLLTKRQALKRATEEQRRASLELHMKALEERIADLRKDLEVAEELASEDCSSSVGESTTLEVASAPSQRKKRLSREELEEQKAKEKRIRRLRAEEGVIHRAPPLTRLERLQLREEALRMGRKATFQMGRKNVMAGLAKQIRLAFLSRHLVKIGIKGRAPGTPVEAIVRQLEASTGGVFVSQEPSKVILYRGWPQQYETLEEALAVPTHLAGALIAEDFEVEEDYSHLIQEPSEETKQSGAHGSLADAGEESDEDAEFEVPDDDDDDAWLYATSDLEDDGGRGEEMVDGDSIPSAEARAAPASWTINDVEPRNGHEGAGHQRRKEVVLPDGSEDVQCGERLPGAELGTAWETGVTMDYSMFDKDPIPSLAMETRGTRFREDVEKQKRKLH